MAKLLIATTNKAKFDEYCAHLQDVPAQFVSLSDLDIKPVKETGETFEENALLKARAYFKLSGLPTLADDGGFEVDALDGEPGVHSHRWLGRETSDEELIATVLKRLKGVPPESRTARLRTVIAYKELNGREHIIEGITEGMVAEEPTEYVAGFPYRGLLVIPQFSKMYSQLTPEEHEQVNQRVKALAMLKPIIAGTLA